MDWEIRSWVSQLQEVDRWSVAAIWCRAWRHSWFCWSWVNGRFKAVAWALAAVMFWLLSSGRPGGIGGEARWTTWQVLPVVSASAECRWWPEPAGAWRWPRPQ